MSAPTSTAETAAPLPAGWDLSIFADEISPDLPTQLAEVARAGLHFFDLRSAFGKNVLDLTDEEVHAIKTEAKKHNLDVQCIGSPINKHPFDPSHRERELARLGRIIEIAKALDCTYIRIFTPFVWKAVRPPEFREIRDWVSDQSALAKEKNVVLLVENDGDAYAAFPENARPFFEELSSPNLRAVYDFSNSVLIGYPALPHWFPWILPYLEALHIKDSIYAKDDEGFEQIVPAGEGEGNMREIFEMLIAGKWRGPVSIEPHLSRVGKRLGLDGIGQFRLALRGLNQTMEGLVK